MKFKQCVILLFFILMPVFAALNVQFEKIEVKGLHTVERVKFDQYLNLHAGQTVSSQQLTAALKRLYQSGLFKDVQFKRVGTVLHVQVIERPVISFLNVSGAEALKSEDIQKVFKAFNLTAGQVYQPRQIEQVRQALLELYQSKGQFKTTIKAEVRNKGSQKVEVIFGVHESSVLKVKAVTFSGNQKRQTEDLLNQVDFKPGFWSFLSGNNQYSRQALDQAVDRLKNDYLNHGFLDVNITAHPKEGLPAEPDQMRVHFKVQEGQPYRLTVLKFAPNAPQANRFTTQLKAIPLGETYRHDQVLAFIRAVSDDFLDRGYAQASIQPRLKLDRAHHTAQVIIMVNPGPLMTVRRIRFFGNAITQDHVLRREFVQYESSVFSSKLVQESTRKINNLGYIRNAQCTPHWIKHSSDLLDLDCFITEAPSVSMGVAAGYGSDNGALVQLNFSHRSLLGSGYGVDFSATRTVTSKDIHLRLFNPYFRDTGISQDISVYASHSNPSKNNISAYKTEGVGVSLKYGIPVSAHQRVTLGASVAQTHVDVQANAADSILDFVRKKGTHFAEFAVLGAWAYDHLDEMIFPHQGTMMSVRSELGLPMPNALKFFKLSAEANWFKPIQSTDWIVQLSGGMGYGRGYGQYGPGLPFFKNYFLGGMQTIRGFSANSLGPHDSEGRAIGGSVQTHASAGLITPQWFSEDVRTVLFFDVGALGQRSLDTSNIRYAAGVAVQWRTALVPIVLSLGFPLNVRSGDRKETFSFELGTVL
ncbi:MAG: outer membrane protein assembly factor BamA [Legionellales bacterium]|nr:outer membrane protein assembly factor BamA [Legionellales bacterium]